MLQRGPVCKRPSGYSMIRRIDPWLLFVAATLAAVVTWVFFHYEYLPMVDLPQHAAALSAWVHLDDPSYGFADQF